MVINPRRRLCTNIDGTLKSAMALGRAVRSVMETSSNTSMVPGWKVCHPTASEMAEVREVQVLESQPGADYPYLLPLRANTTVVVEMGAIEVRCEDALLGELDAGTAPFFNPQGTRCEIRAIAFPTAVLLVSYRERASGQNST